MNKSIIKITCILLLIIIIVLLINIFYLYINKNKELDSSLMASSNANEYIMHTDETKLLDNINAIESELAKNGDNVIGMLTEQKNNYENILLNAKNSEEYLKINSLINTTNKIIAEYELYNNSKSLRAPYHALYTPAVGAIIAYFNSKNYKLSAELLTHAKENNVTDSYYDPIYKSNIKNSKIFENIASGDTLNGTKLFQ